MHSLIEQYLSEVATHLSALPAKQRAEEMREMRAHLENAVIVNRELGQSEDEAARNAVAQFGTARDLGENIVWAWRRGEKRQNWGFWGAVASTPLTLLSLMLAMSHMPSFQIPWLDSYCAAHKGFGEIIGMAVVQGMFLTVFMVAGAVVGTLTPRRAVRAICLGLTVFFVGWTLMDGRSGLPIGGYRLGWILAAVLAAWMVSRSRLAWNRRRRLARG